MCACLLVCSQCLWGSLGARRHCESALELGGTGDCVPPHLVSVIQTEVLCKSSKFSQLPSHLSAPWSLVFLSASSLSGRLFDRGSLCSPYRLQISFCSSVWPHIRLCSPSWPWTCDRLLPESALRLEVCTHHTQLAKCQLNQCHFKNICCMCMNVSPARMSVPHVFWSLWRPEEGVGSPELELQTVSGPLWVLGVEPGFSAWVASALRHWFF